MVRLVTYSPETLVIRMGLTLLYFIVCFFVHPKPFAANKGWFFGMMNHPFRYSDNINRLLASLKITLLPGRFISESMVDLVRLLLGKKG